MGCGETKETNYPTLICLFKTGDEEQKNYCIKLKDNFQHAKSIRFEIKSLPDTEFLIQLKIKDTIHKIQETPVYTDEEMNSTLNKMYKLLDEAK